MGGAKLWFHSDQYSSLRNAFAAALLEIFARHNCLTRHAQCSAPSHPTPRPAPTPIGGLVNDPRPIAHWSPPFPPIVLGGVPWHRFTERTRSSLRVRLFHSPASIIHWRGPLGPSRFVPSFSLAAVKRSVLLWPIRTSHFDATYYARSQAPQVCLRILSIVFLMRPIFFRHRCSLIRQKSAVSMGYR